MFVLYRAFQMFVVFTVILFSTLIIFKVLPHFQSCSLWWPAGASQTTPASRQSSCCRDINSQYVGIYLAFIWPPVGEPACVQPLSSGSSEHKVSTSQSLQVQCIKVTWVKEDWFFTLDSRTRMILRTMHRLHREEGAGSLLTLAQDFDNRG